MTGQNRPENAFLLVITAIALYLCYLLLRPFLAPIVFAIVIGVIFYPLHALFRRWLRRRNLSALASTVVSMVLAIVPLVVLGITLSHEIRELYTSLAGENAAGNGIGDRLFGALQTVLEWFSRKFNFPVVNVRDFAVRHLEQAGSALFRFGATFLGNVISFIVKAVIALVALFFVFRDGESGVKRLGEILPISAERFSELLLRIKSTLVANFYGSLAVGFTQGTLTAAAFWVLGLNSPILWGVITGLFSLIPLVGSPAVWLPASIGLLLTGHIGKGIALLLWGAFVVGLSDNVVRSLIISGKAQLQTLLVFFALLGGVQAFGLVGLFAGPVILSVAIALLQMVGEEFSARPEAHKQHMSSS